MKYILTFFMCLILSAACAGRTITYRDGVMEGLFATETVLDWGQTNGIIQGCREGNAIIGNCGQNMQPGLYFPLVIITHAIVSYLLPNDWSMAFQGATVGIEAKTIYQNYKLGDKQTW